MLGAPADDFFCFVYLESQNVLSGTFVPWGPREALGFHKAGSATCAGKLAKN